jgi:hypothetical protein
MIQTSVAVQQNNRKRWGGYVNYVHVTNVVSPFEVVHLHIDVNTSCDMHVIVRSVSCVYGVNLSVCCTSTQGNGYASPQGCVTLPVKTKSE